MSHFVVLVIGDDWEAQLAPYDENITVDKYPRDPQPDWQKELEEAIEYHTKAADEPAREADPKMFSRAHDPAEFQKTLDRYFDIKATIDEMQAVIWLLNQYEGNGWELLNGVPTDFSTYNPKSKWDWYQLGGRWNGYFDLKPENEPLVPVEPHYSEIEAEQRYRMTYEQHVEARKHMDQDPMTREEWDKAQERNKAPYATREAFMEAKRGTGDLVRKDQIDWQWAREKARVKAEETYDRFARVTAGIEPGLPWEDFLKGQLALAGLDPAKEFSDFTDEQRLVYRSTIDKARQMFREHPFQQALSGMSDDGFPYWGNAHEDFFVGQIEPRDKFIHNAIDGVYVPYSIVLNGEWISKGEMGWFGMSNDKVDQSAWNRKVREILDNLPGDTLIAAVDCHI